MKNFLLLFALFCSSQIWAQPKKNTFVDDQGNSHGLGLLQDDRGGSNKMYYSPSKGLAFPSKIDLRESNAVSAIKDQGSCGSCWSFAITKALESARLKAGLPELDLGEQEMVSCDKEAYGCSGGFMSSADYIVKRGLPLESDYQYSGSDSRCKATLPPVADKAISWAYVGASGRKPTVDELKAAIATYGTLFVTVAAGGADWGGSRAHMTSCGNRGTNHMVTLVGYNEQDEFIIGNSWGKNWGENGFAYAKAGCNLLAGEPDSAAFIVYEQGPAPVPPKVKLPSDIYVDANVQFPVGVPQEPGITYEWYLGDQKVAAGNLLWASVAKDSVYRLTARNALGVAESSVAIHTSGTPPKPPAPGPLPLKECWQNYDEFAFCIGTKGVAGCMMRYDNLNKCIN